MVNGSNVVVGARFMLTYPKYITASAINALDREVRELVGKIVTVERIFSRYNGDVMFHIAEDRHKYTWTNKWLSPVEDAFLLGELIPGISFEEFIAY